MGDPWGLVGDGPYRSVKFEDEEINEDVVISYVALNCGPMGRDVGTVRNHLQGSGYPHKVQFCENPSKAIDRIQNIMRGARLEKEMRKRKSPVTSEDLNRIYRNAELDNPDAVTIWRIISIAWFLR